MAAAAAAADWTNLHKDHLTRIFLLLACITDRIKFSTLCKHWRSVALHNPSPLPWLLMPSTTVTSCYRIFGGFSNPRPSLADHPRGARFCGSFQGGWFVVALEQIRGHALLNLRSGERVQLPDRVRIRERFSMNKGDVHLKNYTRKCPVFIRAATMSAAPPAGDGAGTCVVAALTNGQTNIAFWRPGMDCWATTKTELRGDAEDLAFHDGWFYAITPREELFRYKVSNRANGAIKVRGHEKTMCESWKAPLVSGEIVSRYLLPSASGKDLLMVKRYVHPARGTWRFQVFALQQQEGGPAFCRRFYRMWGQVLFVGRGCSKAFDTGNRQAGCIFFLDDVCPRGGAMSVLQQKQYLCTDTGSFSCLPRHPDEISRCLPQGMASESSPWIWYLQ
uniref:Uncharacterized protein n=1 Tax=Avena sativa TaxID=4498 RepID=A0ACD5UPX3_AVESA